METNGSWRGRVAGSSGPCRFNNIMQVSRKGEDKLTNFEVDWSIATNVAIIEMCG